MKSREGSREDRVENTLCIITNLYYFFTNLYSKH